MLFVGSLHSRSAVGVTVSEQVRRFWVALQVQLSEPEAVTPDGKV